MTAVEDTATDIGPEFVAALAKRAQKAEQLRRLPADTVGDYIASGFAELLVPARFGGMQAPWPSLLEPVRHMAHGCASSAWPLGFYTLHNWMMALFGGQAREEAFATRPFLAPAPLAPSGRGVAVDGGIRLSGRWSWATGVMHGNWVIVGARAARERSDRPLPRAGPAADRRHPGRGRVAHRRNVRDRVAAIYAERLSKRVLAYEGVTQKEKPIAHSHLGEARVRLRALHGLLADTVGQIETIIAIPCRGRFARRRGWRRRTSCTSRGR